MSGGPQPAGGNVCRRAADDINIRANPEIDVGHLPQAARCRHSWQLHVSTHVAVLGTTSIEKSSGTVISPYQVLQTWELKKWRGRTSEGIEENTKCVRTTKFSQLIFAPILGAQARRLQSGLGSGNQLPWRFFDRDGRAAANGSVCARSRRASELRFSR